MVSTIATATLVGVDAQSVEVEVELAQGLPLLSIIGLGDAAVHEARYRIQSALRSSDLEPPRKRTTINLAPADLRKDGAALDLPMALGVLAAAGVIAPESIASTVAVGELALSGEVRPVRGVLSIVAAARSRGFEKVIVPLANAREAAGISGIAVLPAVHLRSIVAALKGTGTLPAVPPSVDDGAAYDGLPDLSDVRGQPFARRAIEIAAAGGHNVVLVGPPGAGKTMLARRIPSLLPPLTADERIEVTKVWSAAGLTLDKGDLVRVPPFRAPHHTISEVALIGGGSIIRPGEISLAHRGVLFVDEMPEVPRRVLDALRQPLEERYVIVARARHVAKLPADFMLVGAANPCPCGWLGDPSGRCRCPESAVARYGARVSGALLDRVDLLVETPALPGSAMLTGPPGEDSETVRGRVLAARARAHDRGVRANADLRGEALRRAADLDADAHVMLEKAMDRLRLSARVLDRTLRVARTIADLERLARVTSPAIAEALRYRQRWGSAPT